MLSALALAALLEYVVPTSIPFITYKLAIGASLVVLAWIIIYTSKRQLKKFSQPSKPGIPTTSLIDSGIFAYSRNPIYVGVVLVVLGVGIAANSVWIVCGAAVTALTIHRVLIRPEEAYLESIFGDAYVQYKKKVRRWL